MFFKMENLIQSVKFIPKIEKLNSIFRFSEIAFLNFFLDPFW